MAQATKPKNPWEELLSESIPPREGMSQTPSFLRGAGVPPDSAPIDPDFELQGLRQQETQLNAPEKQSTWGTIAQIGRGISTMPPAQFQQLEQQRVGEEFNRKQDKIKQNAAAIQAHLAAKRQAEQDERQKAFQDQTLGVQRDELGLQRQNVESQIAERNETRAGALAGGGTYITQGPRAGEIVERPSGTATKKDYDVWAAQQPEGSDTSMEAFWKARTDATQRESTSGGAAGAGGPQQFVIRNGAVTPIQRGTAQPGDVPYDAIAARQQSQMNTPSAYSEERSKRTVESIDRLLPNINSWTTGYGNLFFGKLPESEALIVEGDLNSLKSSIAQNELVQMRQASRTGGALGNISDKDIDLLENAIANLNPRQGAEALKKRLAIVRDVTTRFGQGRTPIPAQSGTGGRPPLSSFEGR